MFTTSPSLVTRGSVLLSRMEREEMWAAEGGERAGLGWLLRCPARGPSSSARPPITTLGPSQRWTGASRSSSRQSGRAKPSARLALWTAHQAELARVGLAHWRVSPGSPAGPSRARRATRRDRQRLRLARPRLGPSLEAGDETENRTAAA